MKCGNSFDQSAVRRVIGRRCHFKGGRRAPLAVLAVRMGIGRRCHFKVVGVRHWLFWPGWPGSQSRGDGAMPTMSLQGGRRVLLVVLLAAGQSWG